jgi:hypothetical protein
LERESNLMLKKLAMFAAATSFAIGGVAVQAAQPLSVTSARAGAETSGPNALRGRSDTTIQIAVLAIVALLIWAGTELFDDDEGDSESP